MTIISPINLNSHNERECRLCNLVALFLKSCSTKTELHFDIMLDIPASCLTFRQALQLYIYIRAFSRRFYPKVIYYKNYKYNKVNKFILNGQYQIHKWTNHDKSCKTQRFNNCSEKYKARNRERKKTGSLKSIRFDEDDTTALVRASRDMFL